MAETRKLAVILAADIAGYSKLAGADEERTLARLRALRSDLIDPTIAVHNGRVVKRTGNASITANSRSQWKESGAAPGRTTEDRAAVPRVVARGVAVHAQGRGAGGMSARRAQATNSSSNALASFRSSVSNPSVNHP
jgi:class 3 adenylate cyclase